jgi:hypothetical protein
LWFTTGGVWVVGNLEMDVTDALGNSQIGAQLVSSDLVAWGNPGIAMWRGALVVPALRRGVAGRRDERAPVVVAVDRADVPRVRDAGVPARASRRSIATTTSCRSCPGAAAAEDAGVPPGPPGLRRRSARCSRGRISATEASLLTGLAVRAGRVMVGAEGGSSSRGWCATEYFDPEVRAVDQDGSPHSFAVTFRDFTSPRSAGHGDALRGPLRAPTPGR